MDKKEFFKTVYDRYTGIGLLAMGIFNVLLLFLYFKRWIGAVPGNMTLIVLDVSLVLGFTLFGIVREAVRRIPGKKRTESRRPGKEDKKETLQ